MPLPAEQDLFHGKDPACFFPLYHAQAPPSTSQLPLPPKRRRPTAARVIAAVGCFPNGMPVHSGILVAGGFRPEQVWGRKQGGVRRIPASKFPLTAFILAYANHVCQWFFEKIFISPSRAGQDIFPCPSQGTPPRSPEQEEHAPPILWIFAVRKDAPSSVTACAVTPSPQWEGVGEHVKTAPACGRGGP